MNQANTQLILNDTRMELYRYPVKLQHKSLQAWDAADEYLINHFHDHFAQQNPSICIVNDEFGALATFLHNYQPTWQTDSKVSQLALSANLTANQLDPGSITQLHSLQSLPSCELYIVKLPKLSSMLEYQLHQIKRVAPANAHIIAAGKVNQVSRQVLSVFEKIVGTTKTSLARKKARLIFSQPDAPLLPTAKFDSQWQLDDSQLTLHHHANVFSRQSLDIGARFMLQHLPDCNNRTVIDLGCGNGVLGLSCMAKFSCKQIAFVDESYMAVASAEHNVQHNFPRHSDIAHTYWSNCLEQVPIKANIVLCNPPFHQQNTITDHIAWQMFKDSYQKLHSGGELRIVGNRHLDYGSKLKRIFGGCRVIAANKKFVIHSAIKRPEAQ